jgi:hypothetical protein
MNTNIDVLKCILAVNLDINIWSAKTKLKPEDFAHSELPPDKLISLGHKRVCDPKDMKIFSTLKARAFNLLDKSGVRFLGGWAVAECNAVEITKGLEEIAEEFNLAKDQFLKRYNDSVQSWIKSNPGWEKIIANSVVSVDYVAKRIAFNWQIFKVANPTGRKKKTLETGLHNEVGKLGSTLFGEISKAAHETWQRSYLGRTQITRKALSPLKTIQQKLADLSFIEPRVSPVASLIQTAFDKVPSKGAIHGTTLLMLQGLLMLLSNTDALTQYAQEILEGRSHESVLDCLIQGKEEKKKEPAKKPDSLKTQQLESHGLW